MSTRRAGLRDPLSPSRAMQRVIYLCLIVAGVFYILPFLLAVVTGFKSLPDFAAQRVVAALGPLARVADPRRPARARQRASSCSGAGC